MKYSRLEKLLVLIISFLTANTSFAGPLANACYAEAAATYNQQISLNQAVRDGWYAENLLMIAQNATCNLLSIGEIAPGYPGVAEYCDAMYPITTAAQADAAQQQADQAALEMREETEDNTCFYILMDEIANAENCGHLSGSQYEACMQNPPPTPIIIDMNGDGFRFTGLDDAVLFDIDGDGQLEITSWTQATNDDAFLIMDRNDNDQVDGGSELFGSGTKLLSGEFALHGYQALAELDQVEWGGNGDGVISVRDRHFSKLALWNDSNHNGVSERNEVVRLNKAGIQVLNIEYGYEGSSDDNGNTIAFLGKAFKKQNIDHKNQVVYTTADVIFRAEELSE